MSNSFTRALRGFSKTARSRAATVLVALYALCVMLPTAALAFSDAPCLTEGHGFVQKQPVEAKHQHAGHEHHAHQHAGSADHDTLPAQADDDGVSHADKCCGLAFFAAVAPELSLGSVSLVLAGRTTFALNQALASLPPDQLIRPPKLLS